MIFIKIIGFALLDQSECSILESVPDELFRKWAPLFFELFFLVGFPIFFSFYLIFYCKYDSESVLSNQRGHVTRKIEKREITFETILWVILRTQKRNFSPSESRENHFLPISIHGEFPDLPIRFWRIGENVVRGIYDI